MEYTRSTVAGVAGAVLVPVAAVWMVSAAGFGSAGIVASSWAAKWMSAQALANGGAIAAGSQISILQSIGAAGLPFTAKAVLGLIGGATTSACCWFAK
mmetsp:Transcript_24560/g.58386  ORF Transcript_24560/g.58386 Transcript_24560/m.58386 type:complete len:98 (+) Transcript_24560:57-350(+)